VLLKNVFWTRRNGCRVRLWLGVAVTIAKTESVWWFWWRSWQSLISDCHELVRALDMNGAAAEIIAELLLLDCSEVRTSVRAAGAACR